MKKQIKTLLYNGKTYTRTELHSKGKFDLRIMCKDLGMSTRGLHYKCEILDLLFNLMK
ncbi:hypothetical protein [PinkBerry-associated phage LS06-2018-MD08]|nr:hypothetical protein [PinkBerry-associated phage LS06-2018-MD08]